MAALNYETVGRYLSHSEPTSSTQIWVDTSSVTSSVICLVDSAPSTSRSLSWHTFRQIYHPRLKRAASSDVSVASDYVRESAVVRVRDPGRPARALSLVSGHKSGSVSRTAQDLINECLERDPSTSQASAVYTKRKTKVNKISTNSVAIDDTGLYCCTSDEPCSGCSNQPGGNLPPGDKPAGEPCCKCPDQSEIIDDSPWSPVTNNEKTNTANFGTEASISQNPLAVAKPTAGDQQNPANPSTTQLQGTPNLKTEELNQNPVSMEPPVANTSKSNRPSHVHCKTRRRRFHPHSWTSSSANMKKITTPAQSLRNALASKFHQIMDSGARLAGYVPLEPTKCGCCTSGNNIKIVESSNKQVENIAPNPQLSNTRTDNGLEMSAGTLKKVPTAEPQSFNSNWETHKKIEGFENSTVDMSSLASHALKSNCSCKCHRRDQSHGPPSISPGGYKVPETQNLTTPPRANGFPTSELNRNLNQPTMPQPRAKSQKYPEAIPCELEKCPGGCMVNADNSQTLATHSKEEPLLPKAKILDHVLKPEVEAKVSCLCPDSRQMSYTDTKSKVSCLCSEHEQIPPNPSKVKPMTYPEREKCVLETCPGGCKVNPHDAPIPASQSREEAMKSKAKAFNSPNTSEPNVTSPESFHVTSYEPRSAPQPTAQPTTCPGPEKCKFHTPSCDACNVHKTQPQTSESQIKTEFYNSKSPCRKCPLCHPQTQPDVTAPRTSEPRIKGSHHKAEKRSEKRKGGTPRHSDPNISCLCSDHKQVSPTRSKIKTKTSRDHLDRQEARSRRKKANAQATYPESKTAEPMHETHSKKKCPGPTKCKGHLKKCPPGCTSDLHSSSHSHKSKSKGDVKIKCECASTHSHTTGSHGSTASIKASDSSSDTAKTKQKKGSKKHSRDRETKAHTGTDKHSKASEKHKTKQHPLKKKDSTDSGSTDSSIAPHKSKRTTGTQSDVISSVPATYKISGIKLQLIGFPDSSAAIYLDGQLSDPGLKIDVLKSADTNVSKFGHPKSTDANVLKSADANESKLIDPNAPKSVDARPRKSCCPCPASRRSGLAIPKVQQRSVGTESEPLSISGANTPKNTVLDKSSANASKEVYKSGSGTNNGINLKIQSKSSLRPTGEGVTNSKQRNNIDTGQEKPRDDVPHASVTKILKEETPDDGSQTTATKDSIHSTPSEEEAKESEHEQETPVSKHKAKNKKSEYEVPKILQKYKKISLATCWPCSLCMGHSKQEASVGDEYTATDHKGVNVSSDETNPPANETPTLRCEIEQQKAKCRITPQISSESCYNHSNNNQNVFKNDCAKLGYSQLQASKCTSMIYCAVTSCPDSIGKTNHSTSMLPTNLCCNFQSSHYNKNQPTSTRTCSNPCCPFQTPGINKTQTTSDKSCTTPSGRFQDSQLNNSQTDSSLSCSNPRCPFQDSGINTSRATSVINFAKISYPKDSRNNKNQTASIVSCPSPSCFHDPGKIINQATSISKSAAEILGVFQDSEVYKSQATSITGYTTSTSLNTSIPSQISKSCGQSYCPSQNSDINKIHEDSPMTTQNQINTQNTYCPHGDTLINKELAVDKSPKPYEELPNSHQTTSMHSSYFQSCRANNYTQSNTKPNPSSSSNTQHHCCCCNKCSQTNKQITRTSENSTDSVKDSSAMAIQNNLNNSLRKNKKTKTIKEKTSARNEATQYSFTIVNNDPKEIVVQRSVSHPNFCHCAANRNRNSNSKHRIYKSVSQQLQMSVLSSELTPSPYRVCCGQATAQKSCNTCNQVNGTQDPLPPPPRLAHRGAKSAKRHRSARSYTQTEPCEPACPSSTADFGQTCDLIKSKGAGVEYANELKTDGHNAGKESENTSQQVQTTTSQTEPGGTESIGGTEEPINTDRQSATAVTGIQFAKIPPNPEKYMAKEGDFVIPSDTSTNKGKKHEDYDTARHASCAACTRSNISCYSVAQGYDLGQKHFGQQYPCPGKDCCSGPASKKMRSQSPSGNFFARLMSPCRSADKNKKKTKPPSVNVCLPKKYSSCCSCSLEKKFKLEKQPKVAQVPSASVCHIKPKPCDFPCDTCYKKLTTSCSSCSAVSVECCSTCSTEAIKPCKQKKIKVLVPCLSICNMKPPKKKSKHKPTEVSEIPCGNICLQKLAGHGVGLTVSMSGSNSCTCSESPPVMLPKKSSMKNSPFPCVLSNISLPKKSSSRKTVFGRHVDDAAIVTKAKKVKPPKQSKKSKSPSVSDFPCGKKCFRKLTSSSGASGSAIYITSRPYTAPAVKGKPEKPPKSTKKLKLPKEKDFPCGKICLQKVLSNSNPSSAGRKGKRGSKSVFSSNSLCLQVTSCSSYNSGNPSKTNVEKQAESDKLPTSAKSRKTVEGFERLTSPGNTSSFTILRSTSETESPIPAETANLEIPTKYPKTLEVCFERLTQCLSSTSNSATSTSISKIKTANPAEAAKPLEQQKLLKAADFPYLMSASSSDTVGVSKRAGAGGSTRTAKEHKPAKQANHIKVAPFRSNSICFPITPCGSAFSANSESSSMTNVDKQIKPTKDPKQAILRKVADFPFGDIFTRIITPCTSNFSLEKLKNSVNAIAKSTKPAKTAESSKLPKAQDFPCGNICSQKLNPSASETSLIKLQSSGKTAKQKKNSKSSKQLKSKDFPCGNICSNKMTPSDSESNLPKSKSRSKTVTKQEKSSKSSKQPKAKDFPCGNICMQKMSQNGSEISLAKSKGSKTAINPSNSAKPPKSPKPAKKTKDQDFPCGNICSQKRSPSASETSLAKSKGSSKNSGGASGAKSSKSAKPPKQTKPPKATDYPCGKICLQKVSSDSSVSSSARTNQAKKAEKVVFPCGNVFSQTKPSPSATKLKKLKPQKAGKGAKSPCSCPPTLTPCGSASSVTKTTQPPKSPKAKGTKSVCKCPPTQTSCGSASSATIKAKPSKPPKSPKPEKKPRSPCTCPPKLTPCGSVSSVTKKGKPPNPPKSLKTAKGSKSVCCCPPTVTPCGSASSVKKTANQPKSSKPPKADKKSKSPCNCPPTLTPCGSKPDVTKTSKQPKSVKGASSVTETGKALKANKKGRSTCVCPPTITPCASKSSVKKTSQSPKADKKSKSSCKCPASLTPCASSSSVAKTAKPPRSPKADKRGKSPCSCPTSLTPCVSASNVTKTSKSQSPPKPRTPVKLLKPNSYKGNQDGVISLEQYEKNKKKRKKTKLLSTDMCLPICEDVCKTPDNDKNKKKQKSIIDCVPGSKKPGKGAIITCECPASEPKRANIVGKWLGIFQCNRESATKQTVVPCQCPASASKTQEDAVVAAKTDSKSGKKYINCSVTSINGMPKSMKTVIPCECPATEPKREKEYIECTTSSLCQLPKSKRKSMICECSDTGKSAKKKGRKIGPSGPGNEEWGGRAPCEDPLNQGIKVQIRKKMCPLFAKT